MSVSRETTGWKSLSEEDILVSGAAQIGVPLTLGQIAQLQQYLAELRLWNRKVNLIGPAEPPEQIILHLIDSLTALPYIPETKLRFLDLGSGAGLPGIPLKILRPGWSAVLAEAREKKAVFIRHAVGLLGLTDTQVVTARIDFKLKSPSLEPFDLIVTRALASLKDTIPVIKPYLKPDGKLVAYKGPLALQELNEAQKALKSQKMAVKSVNHLTLPYMNQQRVLIILQNQD